MKDLTAYFRTSIPNEPINLNNISEETSSIVKNANKKIKRTLTPISDNSSLSQLQHCEVSLKRKSLKIDSKEHHDAAVVYCNESEEVTKWDGAVLQRSEDDACSDSQAICTKRVIKTRTLKNVLLSDCMNSSFSDSLDYSKAHNKNVNRRKARKRKKECDQNELEETELSETLSNSVPTEQIKSHEKCRISEAGEKNNLFNYFHKTEKPLPKDNSNINGSPVDCLKRVKVVVEIHSPPKRLSKRKKIEKVKKDCISTTKLVDLNTIRSFNFDDIQVVENNSKIIETSPVEQRKNISRKAKKGNSSTRDKETKGSGGESSYKIFNSSASCVDEESEIDSQTENMSKKSCLKSSEKKTLRNGKKVSFCGLHLDVQKPDAIVDSDTPKSSDCDDSSWKMRVQFTPRAKIKLKARKSKKNVDKDIDSSEEELFTESTEIKRCANAKQNQLKCYTKCVSNENEDSPKPKKLAPLFCKQVKCTKSKVDNLVNVNDEARKKFLGSGLPEKIKKKIEEQKGVRNEEKCVRYKFPTKSHIQQKTDLFIWNLPVINFTFKTFNGGVIVPKEVSLSSFINKNSDLVVNVVEKTDFDFENEVAMLKKSVPNVNVGDIYASIERLNREAPKADNVCWTEKYKPSNYEDLIGNTSSLIRLREWIESHKRSKITFGDGNSSSEEFIASDDSTSSNANPKNNIAILVGPPGCGKTCSVYILAQKLGFEVLEVNAASNRNGKRLLDELLEATQSHQVKQRTISDRDEKKKQLEKRKKKKQKKLRDAKNDRKTMSLILIEDADILFENHDDGFLSALNTLAKHSKRPLIFTVNDINYPHLTKYRNERNLILKFSYPSRSLINVWLQLIAMTEGVKLSDSVILDLFHIAGLDLRKSLLQLQMIISSKICYGISNVEQLFYQNWWKQMKTSFNTEQFGDTLLEIRENENDLFSPEKLASKVEINHAPVEEPDKKELLENCHKTNLLALENHTKFLEVVASLEHFEKNEGGTITQCKSNTIGLENKIQPCSLDADICSLLKNILFSNFQNSETSISYSEYFNLIRKNSKIKSVYQNTLSNVNSLPSNHSTNYCDILPTLRSIARIEHSKQINQPKKTSRFFSYLKSVNVYISDEEVDFLRRSMI